jgi:hypothetical protein
MTEPTDKSRQARLSVHVPTKQARLGAHVPSDDNHTVDNHTVDNHTVLTIFSYYSALGGFI